MTDKVTEKIEAIQLLMVATNCKLSWLRNLIRFSDKFTVVRI